jgi:hypothetical protein
MHFSIENQRLCEIAEINQAAEKIPPTYANRLEHFR